MGLKATIYRKGWIGEGRVPEWIEQRALIVVRTYPVPAKKGIEVSCTAGITSKGEWIRLYPVPYRFLEEDRRFKKYQWITAKTLKAVDDRRPESYKINIDSITVGASLTTKDEWRSRWQVVKPLLAQSLCAIQNKRDADGHPTLGVFKPIIEKLIIEPAENPNWTEEQVVRLRQSTLFHAAPIKELEKLPYNFSYRFRCPDPTCGGHKLTCTDWEMGQSYRRWRRTYGDSWESAFRETYEAAMINKYDTHFIVGNLHQFPNAWIVIGLFYPPKTQMEDLFA